jgi:lysyl-tRNA synthetase class 2
MKLVALASSALRTIAYDHRRHLLQLEFPDRTVYRYFDVPVDLYEGLLRAPSKGSYFNRFIRGHFVHVRVASPFLS